MTEVPILLVDDNIEVLAGLSLALQKLLPDVEIGQWQPDATVDPESRFRQLVGPTTILVATDYDLTSQGARGLFGHTIVGWCQRLLVPVGDFSRGQPGVLPKAPSLFEMRVPIDDDEAASFIAAMYRGFVDLGTAISGLDLEHSAGLGLPEVLARALGRPYVENEVSQYLSRFGNAGFEIAERIRETSASETPGENEIERAATYLLGHLLSNVILRFPGPILSAQALCAYVSTDDSQQELLSGVFSEAVYEGPFSDLKPFFWRTEVDRLLQEFAGNDDSDSFEIGDFNRMAVEKHMDSSLARHCCDRDGCDGLKGGFLCPFTERTVCLRSDCSVASSSWIPSGATVSRVEMDYHDEWAPLLGQ